MAKLDKIRRQEISHTGQHDGASPLSLLALQRAVAEALSAERMFATTAPDWLAPPALAQCQEAKEGSAETDSLSRLILYRKHFLANFRQALAADYPVVERLVGAEFFSFAAHNFTRQTPAQSGNLNDYGASFAAFLACFAPAKGLPYLADVARLERAIVDIALAADAPPNDFSCLHQVSPEAFMQLRFTLHPALRLIRSPYPIRRIWQANQASVLIPPVIDLSAGGDCLLLRRQPSVPGSGQGAYRLELIALEVAEYVWLNALGEGKTLDAASAEAFSIEASFALEKCLQVHLAAQTLLNFSGDTEG
ncbi:MAG: DNA-binding domain-containing protein [Pseudomonadota bacterium]